MLSPVLAVLCFLASLASPAASWPTLPKFKFLDQTAAGANHHHHHRLSSPHNDTEGVPAGWVDPREGGGRMLDWANRHLGEPLNVIISGRSDPRILTLSGLHNYANSLGYAEECLGLHYGRIHQANLGDGRGPQDEQFLARQTYFPVLGTCWQSLVGGQHWRAWQQNSTKAWFLAASKEMDSSKHHMIVPNGYNLGRDWFVERALEGSSWQGMWWKAEIEWQTGLLAPGHHNINHNISQDGNIAVLTVYRI